MSKVRDTEAQMIIEDLPTRVPDICEHLPTNAYVCVNTNYIPPRLEIWPTDGGWLGIESDQMLGDIAPWHG
jgi:hypothetical protein